MTRHERLQKNAIAAGIRASRKRQHLITPQELQDLKIQVMPGYWRAFLFVAGLASLAFAIGGWPWLSVPIQLLEGILGAILLSFGLIGFRRTFGHIGDAAGNIGAEVIIEGVASVIGSIFD